ncbi:TetR/AcrR family transcriptional regulator [Marinimicrobium agarilyticum]|uniref:TetR/AcrR family transcriptional regulator n=1 Tax=Marinimicrobium agarilyticum TaxID=306546 RepID=UPI0003FF67A4|nr:TetR/AcrR family transcriptional regulator [Marinimicrobium agarilyticum]
MPYSKAHKSRSKDRILKSASELFARYGFDKVSIGQIMKLARMTHGAFYAHFESKQALFKAYLSEAFQRSRRDRLAKEPFSIKHLTALVTDYLNLGALKDRTEPGPESVLFNDIGSDKAEIRQLYQEAYERMKTMLERRITALSRLKKLPFKPEPATVTEKSRSILAAMVGAVAIAKSISAEEEQQRILEAAQQQILTILGLPGGAARLQG